jgi:hypothetical protein
VYLVNVTDFAEMNARYATFLQERATISRDNPGCGLLEPRLRDAAGVVRDRRGGDDRNDLERMIFAKTRLSHL